MEHSTVVWCPYCGKKAELVDSDRAYPQSYGYIWLCEPCGAYVGCHRDSPRFAPLGTLANAELRKLRQQAHKLFDPHWKTGQRTRRQAYEWLARQLNIRHSACHIAMFDEKRCRQVIKLLTSHI